MSLKNFIRQTQMLIQHGLYTTRASATSGGFERPLECARLEERILFSASAIAPVAAELADAGAALATALTAPPATSDGGLFQLRDQQLLDLVADSLLPVQNETQSPSAAGDSTEHTLELVFLDSSVKDLDQMMSDLRAANERDDSRTLEFIVLDSTQDGIAQINSALLRYNAVDGIHIVSRGGTGQVQLGSTWLSINNLDTYRSAIGAWQYSMSDTADILFYGCNLAASDEGQLLLQEISELTDSDTAASEDLTGSATKSGDWDLEYQSGATTPGGLAIVVESPTFLRTEIAFVDSQVTGYQQLLDDLQSQSSPDRHIEVVLVDANRDGIRQISDYLAGRRDVSAVHVLSHGEDGGVELGGVWLNADALTVRASEIAQWQNALTQDADILLYGCDVAADAQGRAFIDRLSQLTGADVAASSDLTGYALFMGNWDLEYQTGRIEAGVAADARMQADWKGLMAVAVDSTSTGVGAGVSSVTFSHTVTSTGNRLMLVGVAMDANAGPAVSSVTYSGQSLTLVGSRVGGSAPVRIEIWQLVNPTSGTADVVVTLSSNADGVSVGATTFTGVDQTTPLGTFASAIGTSNTPSVNVSSALGELVYDVVAGKNSGTLAAGSGQTGLWDVNASGQSRGAASTEAGAASVTMSWNKGSALEWAIGGVSVKPSETTLSQRIASAGDDAEEEGPTGTTPNRMWLNSSDIELVSDFEPNTAGVQKVGLRFTGMNIPVGATITDAYLVFRAIAADPGMTNSDVTNLTLKGQLSGNASTFTTTSGNISSRALTAASTAWTPTSWTTGLDYNSPNIASVIQEIVNQGTWASGNALAIIITGTGHRASQAYDSDPSKAAQLVVTYTTAPVNDPPTATNLSGAESYTEDTALNLTDIVIGDIDSASVTATLTLSNISAGSLNTGTSGAVTSTYNAGTGVWTASGAIADVNTLLAGLTFTPTLNFNSNFTIATSVSDGSLSVTGGKAMTGTAVNDAPVVTVPVGQSVNEDTTLVFSSGTGNQISGSDIDAGSSSILLTLVATNGTATLSGTTGLTLVSGANGSSSMQYTGTLTSINTALDGMSYAPTANFNGSASLAVGINDFGNTGTGGSLSDTKAVSITVNPVADTPSVTSATTNEDTQSTSGLVISRNAGDGAEVTHFKITGLTNGTLYKNDGVTQITSGTFITFAEGNAGLKFTPTTNFNGNGNFTIQASTSNADAGLGGSTINASITVNPINDAPVLAIGATLSYTENGSAVAVDTGITASDVDNATLSTGTVSITTNFASGEDLLSFTNVPATMGNIAGSYNAGTGVMSLSSAGNTATVTQWQAALQAVLYSNSSDNPSTLARKVSYLVNDGGLNSNIITATVNVTAVNDAPTATNLSAAETYTEDTAINLIDIVVSDVDSAGVTATLTLSNAVAGSLNTATSGSVTSTYNAGTGVWSASGAIADINTLLAALTFTPAQDFNSNLTIATSVSDGVAAAITGTKTMTGTAVNDAPVVTNSGSALSFPIGSSATAIDTTLTIIDVDSANLTGATVTVSSGYASGQDVLAFANQSGISGTWNAGTGLITLTGSATLVQYQSALRSITFATSATTSGLRLISFQVSDGAANSIATTSTVLVGSEVPSLWLSSRNSATTSAGTGSLTYNDGQVARFANPNLALGSGISNGTFSNVFNIDTFTGDGNADVNGLHYVNSAVTVGTTNPVSLQQGDILLSVSGNETLGGTAVTSKDVVLFRPTTVGNYSSGTFSVLLNNPGNIGANLRDFALVEVAMTVGGTALQAGDFLMVFSGGAYDKDVQLFRPTTMATTPTGGILSLFIDGDTSAGIGFGQQIYGFDLVQQNLTLGGTSLTQGQLLISLNGNDVVGTNNRSVTAYDVFAMTITATGNTTSAGTASMLLRGSDVGLSAGGEEHDAIAIVGAYNTAPALDAGKTPSLTAQSEDSGVPVGAVGTLISNLVDFASPSGEVDNVTDPDASVLLGIAVTCADTTNGTWHYSINGGTNWLALGAVTNANSLLLAADATARIYFQPNANYNGTIASAITFRAWDQTSGTNGGSTNTTTSGGFTAFSTATDTASLLVNAVNDAPVAVAEAVIAVEAGGVANGTAGTNPSGNVLSNDTDVDSGDTKTVSGVAAGLVGSASGSVGTSVSGSYGEITIAADGTASYVVDNNNAAVQALRTSGDLLTDVFTYTMQDAAGATSTTQITMTIQGANDTPDDLANTGLTVAENAANGTSVGKITRSDVDSSDTPAYSLVDSAGGRFAINASTGVVTVANGSLLNYEAATSHNITVRVTDLAGATYDEVFAVSLTDVNEFSVTAPADVNAAADAVDENSAIGAVVGVTASSTDSDGTMNTITYSLFDSDSGRFAIDAKSPARRIVERVRNGVRGGIGVSGRRGDADRSAIC